MSQGLLLRDADEETALGGREVPYYQPYLVAKKTETERLNNSPKVTDLVSGRSWLKPSHQAPKFTLLTPPLCWENSPKHRAPASLNRLCETRGLVSYVDSPTPSSLEIQHVIQKRV